MDCKYKLLSPDSAAKTANLLDGKDEEEGLRRIQALLSEWLRMENVVVLTAAGCSVGAGGRLMAGPHQTNLECLVLDAIAECDLPENAKKVIEWKRSNNFGTGNFEDWLSYLFNASNLTDGEGSPIQAVGWHQESSANPTAKPLILDKSNEEELKKLISRAIFAECGLEINKTELTDENVTSSGHIPFLSKLISRDANLGRTHLFTLNYDTLFEQALEELGIHYFDGFSGKTNSRFDPSVYGLDIYYPGDIAEGRVRRYDKFIQLYKLHGSLHWYVEEGGYKARHHDLGFTQDYRSASPQEKAGMLTTGEFEKIGQFGILPTSQKFTRTLDMPFAHLFRLFHARLSQPQTFLMVLGYGFGDEHVTRIIETALTNPSLIMLVVEPNPESPITQRIARYQALGQRAFVLTERLNEGESCSYGVATFADFATRVMPDVKWLEDLKQLRKFEDQIRKIEHQPSPPSIQD